MTIGLAQRPDRPYRLDALGSMMGGARRMRLTRWEVISMAIAIGGDAAVSRSIIVRTCRGGSCEVTVGVEVVGADGVGLHLVGSDAIRGGRQWRTC